MGGRVSPEELKLLDVFVPECKVHIAVIAQDRIGSAAANLNVFSIRMQDD
jgi:hypothetical protein